MQADHVATPCTLYTAQGVRKEFPSRSAAKRAKIASPGVWFDSDPTAAKQAGWLKRLWLWFLRN